MDTKKRHLPASFSNEVKHVNNDCIARHIDNPLQERRQLLHQGIDAKMLIIFYRYNRTKKNTRYTNRKRDISSDHVIPESKR